MQVKRITTAEGSREVVRLSRREKQILSGICRGLGYKQIAALYGCSVSNVNQRAGTMQGMLRVSGKDGLFRWAIAHQEIFVAEDSTVDIAMHPDGCNCDSEYCRMMSKLRVA